MRVLPEKISSQLGKKEFLKATAGLTKSLGKSNFSWYFSTGKYKNNNFRSLKHVETSKLVQKF